MPKTTTPPSAAKSRFTELADTVTLSKKGELAFALGGDDSVTGLGGDDTVHGGDGNDTVNAGAGNDLVLGDAGSDVIDSGEGNDTVQGGEGDDMLSAGGGNDEVSGDAGDDVVSGGAGTNVLQGGTGFDTLSYAWYGTSQPLYIDLAARYAVDQAGSPGNPPPAGSGQSLNDQIFGFERVIGASFVPNIIIGDDFANTLEGGNLDDTINGGTGDDAIMGGAGRDVILGGLGRDTIDGGGGDDYYVLAKEDLPPFGLGDMYVAAGFDLAVVIDPGASPATPLIIDFVPLAPDLIRVDLTFSDGDKRSFGYNSVEGGILAVTVAHSFAEAVDIWS
jgi:Ca2+-binding RTX toxin-like protein